MLVLCRRPNESVRVKLPSDPAVLAKLAGAEVEISVVEVRGQKVRLGFTAPREISVDRQEVFDQKHPLKAAG
jgi:carbon storage regulator CsrA